LSFYFFLNRQQPNERVWAVSGHNTTAQKTPHKPLGEGNFAPAPSLRPSFA